MSTGEIGVNATFATLNITASVQRGINLVIGNEHSRLGDLCHIGSVFTSRQIKVFQPIPYLMGLVVVEPHNTTVFCIRFKKSGIICGKAFTESRVFQVLCQASCSIRKSTSAIIVQRGEEIAFSCFITQITTEIPKQMGELHALVSFGFYKLHVGSVFAALHKLTDTLCSSLPRNHLCRSLISCGATFCKVNTVLRIPHGELSIIGLETGTAVIFLFEQFYDFFHRLLLLESGRNHHSRVLGVACQTEHIVNIILGKRKSEGCRSYTLRFINDSDLLLFCWE